jgi:hypothetical protein
LALGFPLARERTGGCIDSTKPHHALAAAHRQTKTIPIVFHQVNDPVSDGFVAIWARPGGNVTDFTIFEHSFAGKWLEMLKEVVPAMTRVAVMQTAIIRPGTRSAKWHPDRICCHALRF